MSRDADAGSTDSAQDGDRTNWADSLLSAAAAEEGGSKLVRATVGAGADHDDANAGGQEPGAAAASAPVSKYFAQSTYGLAESPAAPDVSDAGRGDSDVGDDVDLEVRLWDDLGSQGLAQTPELVLGASTADADDETSVDDMAQLLRYIERMRSDMAADTSRPSTGEADSGRRRQRDSQFEGEHNKVTRGGVTRHSGATSDQAEHATGGALGAVLHEARRAASGTDRSSDVSARIAALCEAACRAVRQLCSCPAGSRGAGARGSCADRAPFAAGAASTPTSPDVDRSTRDGGDRTREMQMQQIQSVRELSASTVESCKASISRLLHDLEGARRELETASAVDPLLLPVAWRGLPTTAAHLAKLMSSDVAALHRSVEAALVAAEHARTDAVRALVDVSAQLSRDRGMLEDDVAAMRAHARAVLEQIQSDERAAALSAWPAARKAADVWASSASRFRSRVQKLASDADALLGGQSDDRAAVEDVVARLLAVDSAVSRSEQAVSASMAAASAARAAARGGSPGLSAAPTAGGVGGTTAGAAGDDFSLALATAARTLRASIEEITAATEAAAREAAAIKGATSATLDAHGDTLSSPQLDVVADKAKRALKGADLGIVERALAVARQRERTCKVQIASLGEQRAALARQFSTDSRSDAGAARDGSGADYGDGGGAARREPQTRAAASSRPPAVPSLRDSISERLENFEKREKEAKLAMRQARLSRSLAQLQRARVVMENRRAELRSLAALRSLQEFADARAKWENAASLAGEAADLVTVMDARHRAGAYAARDALRAHAAETAGAVLRRHRDAASSCAGAGAGAACLALQRHAADAARSLQASDGALTSTVQTLTGAVSALSAFLSDAAPAEAGAEAQGALPPGAGIEDMRAAASRYCRARASVSDAVARGALATWAVSVVDVLDYSLEACQAASDAREAVQSACSALERS